MRLWRASTGMARTGLRSSFAVRVLLVRDPPTTDAGPPDPTGSRLFRANDRGGLLRVRADVHDAARRATKLRLKLPLGHPRAAAQRLLSFTLAWWSSGVCHSAVISENSALDDGWQVFEV